ncbi:MAG: hypothetical protein R3200_04230 [Xanthomonadales bacterium]|nr:hypothetical protein [Xanthomonadales bacterium]
MTTAQLLLGLVVPLFSAAGGDEPASQPLRVELKWERATTGQGSKTERYRTLMSRRGIERLDAPSLPPLVVRRDETGRWIIEHEAAEADHSSPPVQP